MTSDMQGVSLLVYASGHFKLFSWKFITHT